MYTIPYKKIKSESWNRLSISSELILESRLY